MATPSGIRVGTASPATQATTAATLVQLEQLARRAAASQIDILLLPEAYLGGYPRGSSFGCQMGSRSAAGRDEYLRYWHDAVDFGDTVGHGAGAGEAWLKRKLGGGSKREGGATTNGSGAAHPAETEVRRGDGTREGLERVARETGVFLVVGCIEKAGGSLYCAAVYVCPRLGIIGKRRKVMPTATERLIWAQGSPTTLRAVSTTIRGTRINLAAAICWESYMPLVRQALYAQNVNLYLSPTADGRDTWLALMRTVAVEGRCFVVSSNMCVRGEERLPAEGVDGAVRADGHTNGHVRAASGEHGSNGLGSLPRRRSSCVTADGFEIALPTPKSAPTTGRTSTSSGRLRRKSVLDEDGNKIVLCCDETVDEAREEEAEETDGGDVAVDGEERPAPTLSNGPTPTQTSAASGTKAQSQANGSGFVSRGGSCIVSPFGDVLAGPQWEDGDGIIYADVDFEDCIRGRLDLDTGGSYSRNDSFKLTVEGLDLSPLPY